MTNSPDDHQPPAFHSGEIAMQDALGVSERIAERGRRVIRDHMSEQQRDFFKDLCFINLGVIDEKGRPWAIVRTGLPGFISSPDNITLKIVSAPLPGEPADLVFEPGAKVGVVGVQLETRRRNRMNGTVTSAEPGTLTLTVDQSFGNCAQYIQRRDTIPVDQELRPAAIITSSELDATDIALIERSDTLFIASRSPVLGDDPRAGLDVNHRGGFPGFVRVLKDKTLLFPDYSGNNYYNTIGNILLDDRSGLQFLDFENGDILHLSGQAEVILGDNEGVQDVGASRSVSFRAHHIVRASRALPIQFTFIDYWPKMPQLNEPKRL